MHVVNEQWLVDKVLTGVERHSNLQDCAASTVIMRMNGLRAIFADVFS